MKRKTDPIRIIVGVLIALVFVGTVIIGCMEQVFLINLPIMVFCFLLFLYTRLDNRQNDDKTEVETPHVEKSTDEKIDDVLQNIGMRPNDRE